MYSCLMAIVKAKAKADHPKESARARLCHRRGPPKSTADFPLNGTLARGLCSLHAYHSLTPPLHSRTGLQVLYVLVQVWLLLLLQANAAACCLLTHKQDYVLNPCPFCCSSNSPPQLQQPAIFGAANCSTAVNFLGMVHASSCPQLGLHALKARPFGHGFASIALP